MIPFNNQLKVGQPAMIVNVERPENIENIGNVVTVIDLMDLETSKEYFFMYRDDTIRHPYAIIDDGTNDGRLGHKAIRQDYLMPLPPLGDVYDQEKMDEMQNLKIYS